jgi:Zn-dependent hydrolases, including glyoxylases
MAKIKVFYVNDLRECCYIIYDETSECVIVDPGMQTNDECRRIEKFIDENNLKPVKLLCTHGHFDHIMGNDFVVKKWNIPTYINVNDKKLLENAEKYFDMFGYKIPQPPTNTIDLNDNDEVKFGNTILKVITSPGHTKGGVCFYCDKDNFILTGDSLFAGSIGRTDLPGGDYDELMESLLDKVVRVDKDARVLPGHGPETTIINELQNNPFLRYE